MTVKTLTLAWTCLLLTIPCSADIIYVKQGGTGIGSSWADPNGVLQIAINNANTNDQVWVAAGTYKPTIKVGGSSDRCKTFQMKNGVSILGGFPNSGDPNMADRDPNMYETILSGDLNGNDGPNFSFYSDNCYIVFYHPAGADLDPNAILDGFTITAGNAIASGDQGYGGGMSNYFNSPTVTNCTFSGNRSFGNGGGMYNYQSNPTVISCSFNHNFGPDGGGMYNWDSGPTVRNCIFTGNSSGFGGGMYNGENGNPTVTNCTFSGNDAEQGGGMYNWRNSNPTVTGCTFTGNLAEGQHGRGGGMYNEGSSLTVTGCTFSGNLAEGQYGKGGGMYNYGLISLTVTDCAFSGNSAEGEYGRCGGMFNDYSSPTVTNCTFGSNSANLTGGGMENWNYSSPTVTNCTFTGNSANLTGGGMYNRNYSSPTVANCIFTGNWADEGGGIYNIEDSDLMVTDCNFTENSAVGSGLALDSGGGIYIGGGDLRVNDSTFNNSGIASYSDAVITNSNFVSHTHDSAIGNYSGSLIIDNCKFTGNCWGAIYCDWPEEGKLTNSVFIGNYANGYGGAVSGFNGPIENCKFIGNSAFESFELCGFFGSGGGALAFCEGSVTNCTFVGNSAQGCCEGGFGGGMYRCFGLITNCIFWQNWASHDGDQLYDSSDPNYSCIQGWDGGGFGNIVNDPLFADPNGPDGIIGTEDDNLRLLPGSPCIDAGDNNSVGPDLNDLDGDGDPNEPTPFDIDGLPRFYDDPNTIDTGNGTAPIIDMGAHEFIPCDFQPDGDIDEFDFITFILYWLDTGCGRCGGADLTGEGNVDLADVAKFGALWQGGV